MTSTSRGFPSYICPCADISVPSVNFMVTEYSLAKTEATVLPIMASASLTDKVDDLSMSMCMVLF